MVVSEWQGVPAAAGNRHSDFSPPLGLSLGLPPVQGMLSFSLTVTQPVYTRFP